jgi:hypothetical protein
MNAIEQQSKKRSHSMFRAHAEDDPPVVSLHPQWLAEHGQPRLTTLSIAVPASILDHAKSKESKTWIVMCLRLCMARSHVQSLGGAIGARCGVALRR